MLTLTTAGFNCLASDAKLGNVIWCFSSFNSGFPSFQMSAASVFLSVQVNKNKLVKTINDFLTVQPVEVAGLSFFERSKTEKQIARSICLPTVASTAVNFIFQDKIIGDSDGSIRVGDFYKVMLPLHKVEPTSLPLTYDMGWRITDDKGNT